MVLATWIPPPRQKKSSGLRTAHPINHTAGFEATLPNLASG
jgi:hypothetical protein